jgi:hypothetical protein
MTDLAKAREVAHRIHNVVRRFPFGLVDDERTVVQGRLWSAWHFKSEKPSIVSSQRKILEKIAINSRSHARLNR